MSKSPVNFDLLIVYSHQTSLSASHSSIDVNTPFSSQTHNQSYNIVYSYFLQTCAKYKLSAAFTTSADIIGPGLCSHYWTYENKKWQKHAEKCTAHQIFDKFAPVNQDLLDRRALLFSAPHLRPFNYPQLQSLFFDKDETYKALSSFTIPTTAINKNTLLSYQHSYRKLQKIMANHPHPEDFSSQIVLKDRYGAGGQHIYKFNANSHSSIASTLQKDSKIQFILQPFLKFDRGYLHQNEKTTVDIRIIFFNDKIVQSYIRIAQEGNFKCNEHQGGSLIYLPLSQIPTKVVDSAEKISQTINYRPALYALDFLISNQGNVYFLEGNTGPGLDWNLDRRQNELESKKLIRLIIKYFAQQKQLGGHSTIVAPTLDKPLSQPPIIG